MSVTRDTMSMSSLTTLLTYLLLPNLCLAVEVVPYSVESAKVEHLQPIFYGIHNSTSSKYLWAVETTPNSSLELVWNAGPVLLSVNITEQPPGVDLLSVVAHVNSVHKARITGVSSVNLSSASNEDGDAPTGAPRKDTTFLVQPVEIGRTKLDLTVYYRNTSLGNTTIIYTTLVKTLDITVIRRKNLIDIIFEYSIYGLLVIVTLSMGAELDLATVKKVLRRPKAPLIALFSQFVFMPLLAYGIVWLQGYSGGTALGFFTLGIAPGGGPSSMYSHLLGGDMSVSVTMTLLSTVLSLGMMPLWLYTLGTTFARNDSETAVPFMVTVQTMLVLSVPLAVGLLISWKLPQVGRFLRKCLKVLMVVVLLFLFTFGIYTNLYIFEMFDLQIMLTGALLPYGGFLLGAALAFICKMEWKLIKTISIETGLQNAAIPFIIIQTAFSSPDLELAIIPVVWSIIATPVPLIVATACYLLYNKCTSQKSTNAPSESDVLGNVSDEGNSSIDKATTEQELVPLYGADESRIISNIQEPPAYDRTLDNEKHLLAHV